MVVTVAPWSLQPCNGHHGRHSGHSRAVVATLAADGRQAEVVWLFRVELVPSAYGAGQMALALQAERRPMAGRVAPTFGYRTGSQTIWMAL